MLTPYDKRNMVLERAQAALEEGDHYALRFKDTQDDADWSAACSAWGDGMRHLDIVLGAPTGSRFDPRGYKS